ncbi:MAG: hypothetical protein ABSE80_13175, partial [Halobacteriota archaeon]
WIIANVYFGGRMTPEAQNTILEWIFYGLAVVGFYIVIVAPVIYIWHKTLIPTPLPDKKIDDEMKRWRQ